MYGQVIRLKCCLVTKTLATITHYVVTYANAENNNKHVRMYLAFSKISILGAENSRFACRQKGHMQRKMCL